MSAELDAFRSELGRWLDAQQLPGHPASLDERFDLHRDWQRRLYDAGYLGLAWPVEWGGRGLGLRHQYILIDELAARAAPHPIGLIGLDVVGPSIGRFGTAASRALLPALLSGDEIWCQGFSEPDAGSDLAAIRTRATVDDDGFTVSGQKIWTSWAHKADRCALLARSDPDAPPHKGLSYLVVDMAAPGITVRPLTQMTGESEFCEVFFDDVRVPRADLVGELHGGWSIAMDTLGHERGTYSLRRRGDIASAVADVVHRLRRAGAPGTLDDTDRTALGAAFVALRVLRAQNWATLARMDESDTPSALDSVDKLVLNDVEQQVFGTVKDLLGSSVVMADGEVHGLRAATVLHDYLYSRAISIYGGSAQIQRTIVAERHLDLPRG